MIGREERFADVEAGKKFFFEDENLLAGPRHKSGCATAARTAADDHGVENIFGHAGTIG